MPPASVAWLSAALTAALPAALPSAVLQSVAVAEASAAGPCIGGQSGVNPFKPCKLFFHLKK
jgi:hypothetical protein